MIELQISDSDERGLNILCLGAHCDDIEIGCGGTLLNLRHKYNIQQIHWVVFCSNEIRKNEAGISAGRFLDGIENKAVVIHSFKDGYMPAMWSNIKDAFEELKNQINPDLIFTHTRHDRHQDHRIVHDFTWNTFRNHMILEYEIPKYDGDLGRPNLFSALSKEIVKQKNRIILESFESQRNKHWLDEDLLTSLMRIRGVECVSESGYAEAFYCRKMTL